ncbi:hypothetical protein [Novosphingobium resinovorum]|uniref:hypothetical protein n=1 Tax=Novosphingobium resinovorum TaxID=158500 RepID=UPI0012E9C7DA|nr:hypothetical protein [Novosphingobium resinovorum]
MSIFDLSGVSGGQICDLPVLLLQYAIIQIGFMSAASSSSIVRWVSPPKTPFQAPFPRTDCANRTIAGGFCKEPFEPPLAQAANQQE